MKKNLALVLISCIPLIGFSQQFIGYSYDNYSGIPGMLQNPASVAGSKFKLSFNVFSISMLAGNNAYEIKSDNVHHFDFSNMEEGKNFFKSPNTDKKNLWMNADIIGPSLMVTTGKKSGIGLYTRMRMLINEYNLSDKTFRYFNADSGLYNVPIQEQDVQAKAHTFGEAGLTYGRIIYRSPKHVLKMGITGKYIVGLAAASTWSKQMNLNIAKTYNINELKGDANVRYSSNLDNIDDNFGDIFKHINDNKGWGLDIGFSYEWRPLGSEWLANDQTPYRVKLNAAITDIGSVKYTNSKHGNSYAVDAGGFTTDDLQKNDNETFDEYFTRLQNDGIIKTLAHSDELKVKLPTALRVDADWHLYKRLFINVGTVVNLISKNNNPYSAQYATSFTLTPRLEKKWFSLYSPIYYNREHKQIAWGAGLRLGQLFIGSGSILSTMLGNKNISAADFHMGFAISIYQRVRTRKIRVKEEPVEEVKQPEIPQPAPKIDTVEKKVEVIKEVTHDRDNDGVTDEKDVCPDIPGEVTLSGCPDKDKDGIADKDDKCPDVPGTVKYQGCPIPDTDGDGIDDENDKCPNTAGTAKYHGCPVPDTDGDGVDDENDKCPATPGKPENHGCPEIKQAIVKKVNATAKSIYFLSGKDIIQKISYPKLNTLVTILNADKDLLIIIEGHTDNRGSAAINMKLSAKRAQAVKNYLMKKGIAESRITAQGFGNTKPIATNATPAGRAKNRRVELHLSY
jgi:outer membrane protein OmpA-like peptidoglycan-associated protein